MTMKLKLFGTPTLLTQYCQSIINKLLSLLGNIVAGRSVRLEILCIMRGTIKDLLLLSQNLQ